MRISRGLFAIVFPVLAATACASLAGLQDLPVPEDSGGDGMTMGTDAAMDGPGLDTSGGSDVTMEGAGMDAHSDSGLEDTSPVDTGVADTAQRDGIAADAAETSTPCVPGAACTPANACDQGILDCM